jgi:putative spermidine/putrescine transport system permease protein
MASEMIKKGTTAAAMLTPATMMVVVFLALPMLLLLRYSFNQYVPGEFMVEGLTVANYVNLLSDSYYLNGLRTTVTMAFGVTVFCIALGLPLASFISRQSGSLKTLLLLMIILPLFVSNAVRAAGWMVAFGQNGVVNYLLGASGLISQPLTLMYTPTAVFIGIVSVNLPYVVLTLQSVLEGLDPNTKDASLSLGAGPFETFRLVTVPLVMPGILAAFVLSFILTMNAYATPVLLGGPSFRMMAPMVVDEVLSKSNWPFGATLSFILMAVTLILTIASSMFIARRYRYTQ